MEQTKDVVTQIRTHYDSFSKSHRRLADFILENLHEVAFLSINELSQRTGISPATITRFARRLDFQGYPDLQRGLYEHQKQWAPFGQLKSLLRRETPAEDAGPDSLQWTIQNNIGLLEALYTPQLRDSFARAIENQMFVVACNRVGPSPMGTYCGHSIIIDPWGDIIAEGGGEEEIITGSIDYTKTREVRDLIHMFRDRQPTLYGDTLLRPVD